MATKKPPPRPPDTDDRPSVGLRFALQKLHDQIRINVRSIECQDQQDLSAADQYVMGQIKLDMGVVETRIARALKAPDDDALEEMQPELESIEVRVMAARTFLDKFLA
jgi:hypothetical protein